MDLRNSSEIQEAARLLGAFRSNGRLRVRTARPVAATGSIPVLKLGGGVPAVSAPAPSTAAAPQIPAGPAAAKPAATRRPLPAASVPAAGATLSREQVIQGILESMCRRGGFQGAVIADDRGLILAEFNCPLSADAVAACSSILGEPMKQAGGRVEHAESRPNIDQAINKIADVDKIVMRQFQMDHEPYYLIVISPQDVDERSELEVTIDQLLSVLTRRG
jgi:hypothetical protein